MVTVHRQFVRRHSPYIDKGLALTTATDPTTRLELDIGLELLLQGVSRPSTEWGDSPQTSAEPAKTQH